MDLTVGFVRGSHGLKGEVKIESASGRYEHIAKLKEVTLRRATGHENGACTKYAVESARIASNALYMKFAGIDSPEAAKKLNGAELRTARENACPLNEGEWYIEDLKQCSLVYCGNENGNVNEIQPCDVCEANSMRSVLVGSITDVLEGGAGELLEVLLSEDCSVLKEEVKLTASGKPRTVLVPFNETYIGKVDIQQKSVQLMHLWILE